MDGGPARITLILLIGFILGQSGYGTLLAMESKKRKREEPEKQSLQEAPAKELKIDKTSSRPKSLYQISEQAAIKKFKSLNLEEVAETLQTLPTDVVENIFPNIMKKLFKERDIEQILKIFQSMPREWRAGFINHPFYAGKTLIFMLDNPDDITKALELGADPNVKNIDGQTFFNYCTQEKLSLAHELIKTQEDLDITSPDIFNISPLMNAFKQGDTKLAQTIMQKYPKDSLLTELYRKNKGEQTQVYLAAKFTPKLLRKFDEAGFDIYRFDILKNQMISVQNNEKDEYGIRDKNTLLMELIDDNDISTIANLFNYVRPNFTDEKAKNYVYGYYEDQKVDVAHYAALMGRLEILSLLLEAGYPIDEPISYETMLMTAAYNHNLPVVEYLVRNRADVNLELDPYKGTSLQNALEGMNRSYPEAKDTYKEILKYLLENGALVTSILDKSGNFDWAIERIQGADRQEITQLLEQYKKIQEEHAQDVKTEKED